MLKTCSQTPSLPISYPGPTPSNRSRLGNATLLFMTIKYLDIDALRSMLSPSKTSLQAHVNDLDENGLGLLHHLAISVQRGVDYITYEKALDAILFVGRGNVNLISRDGDTALTMAAHCGNHEFAKEILKYRPDIKICDSKSRSVLTIAQKRAKEGEISRRKSPSGEYKDLFHHTLFLQLLNDYGKQIISKTKDKCLNESKSNYKTCNSADEQMDMSTAPIAERYHHDGNSAFKKGQFQKAEKFYSLAIKEKENPFTLSNRAASYLEMGKWRIQRYGYEKVASYVIEISRRALEDAQRASEIDPTFPKSWYRQAKAYIGMRDFHSAVIILQTGLDYCEGNKTMIKLFTSLKKFGVSTDCNESGTLDGNEKINIDNILKLYLR